jgi:hypothetical protein
MKKTKQSKATSRKKPNALKTGEKPRKQTRGGGGKNRTKPARIDMDLARQKIPQGKAKKSPEIMKPEGEISETGRVLTSIDCGMTKRAIRPADIEATLASARDSLLAIFLSAKGMNVEVDPILRPGKRKVKLAWSRAWM